VVAMLLLSILLTAPRIFGFSVFVGYLISGPIYTVFFLSRKSAALPKPKAGSGE
jgi:CDP-diacylglycerol--serine O-phosphatidyltransferase